ncbi:hypothetical protein SBV1_730023 [Verrucomicrobia bacterium]|nr:hypothetical protein SBV1_730023 [Verrucomicrobiota bacterium]
MNIHFSALGDKSAAVPIHNLAKPVHRVLVIDDDPDIRQLFADVLLNSGYQVDTAADTGNGWKVLHAVRHDPDGYDLLITDNNLPQVSGLELVRKVRAERMGLPVILASGQLPAAILSSAASTTPIKQLEWNRALQIDAILLKPFTIEELLGTVKAVLSAADSSGGQIELPQLVRRPPPPAYGCAA